MHSREQARKQIDASTRLHSDDAQIRDAFQKFSVSSTEEDKHAHIPKSKLLNALKELDREISADEVDDFFKKHDLNGDGFFDLDEFKLAMSSPHPLPAHRKIKQVFDEHSDGTDHILPDSIGPALNALSLKKKTVEKVRSYFEQGALSDGKITFEEFNQAILSTSPLPDEQEVVRVFQEHAVAGRFLYIPIDKLKPALLTLGLVATKDQLTHFERTVQLNFNGRIKYNAFKHIVKSPSPAEVWAETLPLARLLANALPKHSGCDHLRVVSSLTPAEVDVIAEEVGEALKSLLKEHVGILRTSFASMEEQVSPVRRLQGARARARRACACGPCSGVSAAPAAHAEGGREKCEAGEGQIVKRGSHMGKFDVVKMKGGSIEQFHEGFQARVGQFLRTHTTACFFRWPVRSRCSAHKWGGGGGWDVAQARARPTSGRRWRRSTAG